WKLRTSRTQKIKVRFDTPRLAGNHTLRKRNRSGNPCRIFINVKRMVEMRNTQAFQIQVGIEHEVFDKISFEKRVILRPENVKRQRVAALLNGVNSFLKLSKHGLPEKHAPQVVDFPVDI